MLAHFQEKAAIPQAFYELTSTRLRRSNGEWADIWRVQLFADGVLLCEETTYEYADVLTIEDWFKERIMGKRT